MRTAEDIVRDYRKRGYDEERLRALANNRKEPVRSEMLALLELDGGASEPETPLPETEGVGLEAEADSGDDAAGDECDAPESVEEHAEIDGMEADVMAESQSDDAAEPVAETEEIQEAVGEEPAKDDTAILTDVDMSLLMEEGVSAEDLGATDAGHLPLQGVNASDVDALIDRLLSIGEPVDEAAEPEETEAESAEVAALEASEPGADVDAVATDELHEVRPLLDRMDHVADCCEMIRDERPGTCMAIRIAAGLDAPLVGESAGEPAEAVQGSLFESAGAEAETSAEPSLAEVEVAYLSPAEYFARGEVALGVNVIDLREEEESEQDLGVEEDETVGFLKETGEVWPSAASIEMVEHSNPPLSSTDSSVLYVFPQGSDEESMADSPDSEMLGNPAARRSLEVLAEYAASEDADTAAAACVADNIVRFDPPYATSGKAPAKAGQEDSVVMLGPDDVMIGLEESSVIRFPTEMLDVWQAMGAMHGGEGGEGDEATGVEASEELVETMEDDVSFYQELDQEMARLRGWLVELEDAMTMKNAEIQDMVRRLGDRDETLALQAGELTRLREELSEREALLRQMEEGGESVRRLQRELESMTRQNNVLNTETVPNLQKDRDDLVALLEERQVEEDRLRDSLTVSTRRSAVGYTLAAAAAILVVTMPVMHWLRTDQQKAEFAVTRAALEERLAAAERLSAAAEDQVRERLAAASSRHEEVVERLRGERERLDRELRESRTELAGLRNQATARRDDGLAVPNPADTARAYEVAHGRPLEDETAAHLVGPAGGARHYNDVVGVDEWQRQQAARTDRTVREQVVKVRSGDVLARILRREVGRSDQAMIDWVVKRNKLVRNSHGHPVIHPNQKLVLPADARSVASLE